MYVHIVGIFGGDGGGAIFVAFMGIKLLSTKIVQCRMGMIACAREYYTVKT